MNYLPMLASATSGAGRTFQYSLAQLNGGAYIAQFKLDGHRAMLHKNRAQVAVYSRNGTDITSRVPKIVEEARRRLPTKIILDGELMTDDMNPDSVSQVIMSREVPQRVVRFYPFDIPSMNNALGIRLQALRKLGRDTYIRPLHSYSDLEKARQAARAKGMEGIVVKHLQSPYQFGQRSKYWLKFKFTETISAIVTGFTEKDGDLRTLSLGLLSQSEIRPIGKLAAGWTVAEGRALVEHLRATRVVIVEVEHFPSADGRMEFGGYKGVRHDIPITAATVSQIRRRNHT